MYNKYVGGRCYYLNDEIKKLKSSYKVAVLMIIIFIIMATGVTYAWFNFSALTSTNVTPTGGTISVGESIILISNSRQGPFEKTCKLALEGNPERIRPVTTEKLEHFFEATAQNTEGVSLLYKNVDDDVNKDMIHGTVYLQCLNAPCDVYFEKDNLKLGSDNTALASMRLGLKITSGRGEESYIFKLDDLGNTAGVSGNVTIPVSGDKVVSDISDDGRPQFVDDPALNIGEYMATKTDRRNEFNHGKSKLMSLVPDEVATVEYWMYLEGCDEQCINAAQGRDAQISLAFAGVDTSDRQKEDVR